MNGSLSHGESYAKYDKNSYMAIIAFMAVNPRSKRFLEELPKNGNKIKPSAIKAGYKPSYAHANGRTILRTAIKEQAKDVIATLENDTSKPIEVKELKKMYELIGMIPEDVYKNIRFLVEQDKDLSTRLKVISALAKELGFNLTEEAPKTIVPILNIGVKQVEPIEPPQAPLENGLTEPQDHA